MLEVEVKYRIPDRAALGAALRAAGAERIEERTDVDRYYRAPDRDFRQSDEAFRLRRIGPRNCLTYKGPKRDATTKTRTEIEVPLGEGDAVAADVDRMLVALGYRPVADVRKRREVHRLVRDGFEMEACIDELERIGSFAELEIRVEEGDCERAKAAVLAAAAEFGLRDVERRSYLGLVLEGDAR